MFTRVLVANRGEIAVRIIKTLRKLGVRSVLAASVPDRHSLAARMADEVVLLEGSRPDETYLHVERIMNAAESGGCEAIHPGYGFLSESPLLAEACNAVGITFIGPSVDVLRTLGDKTAARDLAVQSGIPVVPGWDGEGVRGELGEQVARIGYPLMVKARGGGGGRGMRRVDTEGELEEALASARREAEAAFGDERVFIERYVTDAHHVEVQVLADQHGAMVHLGERDCSVQRRHQKLIEETPSPIVDDSLRIELTEAALTLMRAAGYVNAGTVEFLIGPEDGGKRPFYFIEVNPRLQVEHTVTEEVTGLDLVELQLRIAAGEPLPFAQDEVEFNGHAIELRINAEDPYKDFRPSSGRITLLAVRTMDESIGVVRFDTGIDPGDVISTHYDSLLGKLIVQANSRDDAIWLATETMHLAHIGGVSTNLELCKSLVRSSTFQSGGVDTDWLESSLDELLIHASSESDEEDWTSAALALLSDGKAVISKWIGAGPTSAFITNGRLTREVTLSFESADSGTASVGDFSIPFRLNDSAESLDASPAISFGGDAPRSAFSLAAPPPLPKRVRAAAAGSLSVTAPLAGTIGIISVEAGQAVESGDLLLVLEAMKMEHRVTAPSKGIVSELHVQTGQVVSEGDELVVLGEASD